MTSNDLQPSTALAQQSNDASFANIFQELQWRGLIQVSTDPGALEKHLSEDVVTYYCGFDPTAASLHLGHLVQLLLMRRLQIAGHKPLALVGGSTGLIGDPRPTTERSMQTKEQVSDWVSSIQAQVQPFLDFSGDNAARMVNNLDWTAPISAIDFLRDIGKYFRVGTMIKKDIVATRLNSDEGISYAEFSYQILQGFDFLSLFRQYGCTLQSGGSDQWGNLTSGTELVRKTDGQTVHAVGTPLITNADGTKFGKSEGNAIWLNPQLTSPYEFYQFWLNTADEDVVERLKVFTFRSKAEIEALAQAVTDAPHLRQAQKVLAWEVNSLVHGEEATKNVIAASAAVFGGGDLAELDSEVLLAATAQLPKAQVSRSDFGDNGIDVIDLFDASPLVDSKSAARRTISEGGAYVNNQKISGIEQRVQVDELLHEKYLLLRRGKRNLAVIEVTS